MTGKNSLSLCHVRCRSVSFDTRRGFTKFCMSKNSAQLSCLYLSCGPIKYFLNKVFKSDILIYFSCFSFGTSFPINTRITNQILNFLGLFVPRLAVSPFERKKKTRCKTRGGGYFRFTRFISLLFSFDITPKLKFYLNP